MFKELNETLADHPGRAKNADFLPLHVPLSISEAVHRRPNPPSAGLFAVHTSVTFRASHCIKEPSGEREKGLCIPAKALSFLI
jgi:hypothetical protein